MSGLGSLYLPLPNFLGRRYFCGWILVVLKVSMRGVFVAGFGVIFRVLRSSHLRCFLLLRHFALMFSSPDIIKGSLFRNYKMYRTGKAGKAVVKMS